MMGVSIFCFGFIENMTSRVNILVFSFILRFIQGSSASLLWPAYFIIPANDYPERKIEIFGLVEAMIGFGFVLGPIIGSVLYGLFGFKGTFFVYGGLAILIAITMRMWIPDRKRTPLKDEESNNSEQFLTKSNEVTLARLLCVPRVFFGAATSAL